MKTLLPGLLIVVMSAFATPPAFASGFLQYYMCDSKVDAIKCSNCSKIPAKIRYLINRERRFVLQQSQGPSGQKSVTWHDCDIVDENNWTCKSSFSAGTQLMVNTLSRTDGVVNQINETYQSDGKIITDGKVGCAK
jgi:hypothetical protein